MPDPDPDPDHAPLAEPGASDDAELVRLEAALALALGAAPGAAQGEAGDAERAAALAAFGDPRPSAATPARPSFRASLRASFVSGRFEGDGAPPASVARALDAALLPPPDPEFRAALRARFLAAPTDETLLAPGDLLRPSDSASDPGTRTASTMPGAAARGPRPGAAHDRGHTSAAGEPRQRRRSWLRSGVVAALAASLLAAVLLRDQLAERFGAQHTPRWTLFGADPLAGHFAGLLIDGAPVTDRATLEARLRPGAAVETGAAGLRLAVGGDVLIDLGPSTCARLPGYTVGGGLTFELERGALRIATGKSFQPAGGGRRLAIVTPHLEALAVGTVLGVDTTADYTCVCCFEGEALTRSLGAGGAVGRVDAGRTRLVYADGRELELELVEHHRAPLVELRDVWRA